MVESNGGEHQLNFTGHIDDNSMDKLKKSKQLKHF